MYWRSVRLFDGVVLLLRKRLPEEALMLARSLFVEALRLAEIAGAGGSRGSLVLGWANASIEEKKGLLKEATRLGLETDPAPLLAELDAQQKKLQNYRARKGIGSFRNFLSERAAAERFGRTHDYWTYVFAHEFVHGTDAAFTYSRTKTADGTLMFHDQTNDPQLTVGVACFAAKSLLQGAAAVAQVFGWKGADAIDALAKEVLKLEEQQKSVAPFPRLRFRA